MSYILDALRKSEQQRQRDVSPLLFTTQISTNVEKQPVFLIYGLVAAVLICVGILIGWLRPWQHDKAEPLKDSVALTQQPVEKLAPIATIAQPLPPEPEQAIKPERVQQHVQKPISTLKPVSSAQSSKHELPAPTKVAALPPKSQTSIVLPKGPERRVDETAVATAVEKAIPTPSEPAGISAANEASQVQKIIAITELPLAIQQEIPAMSISGYAYSSIPKERSVGINERLLQEGEYLAPGLRLEQITADGLVFSYKKYLFRHSL